MWNTEQAYMLACEGTPEEENAVDKYSKMIWEAAQKEHEKLVNPVNTDNPDFDKKWNEDRLLQNLDDSESKMSIGEYAKYWFQKGQESERDKKGN